MALSAQIVWEVRPTGNDENGGGYKAGATGFDWSQQNGPHVNIDGATITAVVHSTTTQMNITGYTVSVNDSGNIYQNFAGTSTSGFYEITAADIVNNRWTVDRSLGTAAQTCIGKMGGALRTINKLAVASTVGSQKMYVQGGPNGEYNSVGVITFSNAGITPGPTVPYTHIIGYSGVRGDITPFTTNQDARPRIYVNTLAANVLTFSNTGWQVENLIVGPSGVATCGIGLNLAAGSQHAINCKAFLATAACISLGSTTGEAVFFCEASGATNSTAAGILATNGFVLIYNCWSHDHINSAVGINVGGSATVLFCVVSNCPGSQGDGIRCTPGSYILNNTVYNSGRHGIFFNGTASQSMLIKSNVLTENASYGLSSANAALPATFLYDGNAYYGNTLGTRNNFDDLTSNPIDNVSPYTTVMDIILTNDPFVNKMGNDFRINNLTGGGALIRGMGEPTVWPGLLQQSYIDMGAFQFGPPIFRGLGMQGGFR